MPQHLEEAAYLPLKVQWFHILAALSEQDRHGYGIMQDILERTEGKVKLWPPTLYGSIRRLLEEEFIEDSPVRPAAGQDDPRRKYYRITERGHRVLRAECSRVEDLIRSIQPLRLLGARKG